MTDKNTYWLNDGQDTYGLVTGAVERDRWAGLGWSEVDEPAEGFLWVWRDGIQEPGRTSVEALREVYQPAGWLAGPPPGGQSPFLAAADSAEVPAGPADGKPNKSSKPAAGGVEKE